MTWNTPWANPDLLLEVIGSLPVKRLSRGQPRRQQLHAAEQRALIEVVAAHRPVEQAEGGAVQPDLFRELPLGPGVAQCLGRVGRVADFARERPVVAQVSGDGRERVVLGRASR